MSDGLDLRVAIWMPTTKDGRRTAQALAEAGIAAVVGEDITQLKRLITEGVGAVILTEELLSPEKDRAIQDLISAQPPWSDLPFILVARNERSSSAIRETINAILVEYPVRTRSLISAVRSALRSRRQQYKVRDQIAERERSQAAHRYLVQLHDALRPLSDPVEIQSTACRLLGQHLQANRVAYFETSKSDYIVADDFHQGVQSVVGRYPLSSFGDRIVRSFRANQAVVEDDAIAIIGRSPSECEAFNMLQVRAHVDVPLIKDGDWVGGLTVHFKVPHLWRREEVSLIEETAERTWAAVVRAKAERSLRESEDRFRTLFESMDTGYCVVEPLWDADGNAIDYRYHLANRAIEEHTGLKDIVGKTARELMPEHEKLWITAYGNTARTGESFKCVDFVKDLNSWFNVSAFRIGTNRVGVLFTNVSSQRMAEEKLRASEARLAAIFWHAPSFMAVLSGPEMVFERVNDRFLALIGNRDVIGRSITEAMPEIEGQSYYEMLHSVFRTGEARSGTDQRVALIRDGHLEMKIVDFVCQPLHDESGGITGVLVQGIDTTERVRAQIALRQQDERLQLAVAIAHMGTFELDLVDQRIAVNEPGRDILGWKNSTSTFSEYQSQLHREDQAFVLSELEKAFQSDGSGDFEITHRILRLTGGERWVKVRGKTFFEGNGDSRRAVLCVGAFLDITSQKQAEHELLEADRNKDEFIALLAHELRNPLAPISNGLQLLKLGGPNADALAMMDRQLTHMVRLVDDLLDISRIGRNKLKLQLECVDLAAVIASAIETANPLIVAANHALRVSAPGTPIYVNADLTRLAQVFANLLTNAAKYTPQGGTISIHVMQSETAAIVEVSDNGIGIPEGELERVFNMFSQVERSIERSTGGLGIGLALVKALTEMHGGKVAVRSGEQGSVFTVELPISAPVKGSQASGIPVKPLIEASLRVLVVDDNRDSSNTLSQILRVMGAQVMTAYDGLDAINAAETYRPQLILMDIGMPRLNGYEATREIRKQEWGKEVTIVALSGWGQESDKRLSEAAGCDRHLVKPINYQDLCAVLDELQSSSESSRN